MAAGDICLFLCGDVMLGRGIDQILLEPCDPELHESYVTDARVYVELAEQRSGPIPRRVPPAYPWGESLALLAAAAPNARIINLETAITRSDSYDPDKGIHYRCSPENAVTLSAAQIDVCVLGNNHVLDWDEPGLFDTLATLDRLGIARCGAGEDLAAAVRPAIVELGERGRVAVFSLGGLDAGVPPWWAAGADRPGVNATRAYDDDALARTIDAIEPWRDERTAIVVSIHWGPNWGFSVPVAHRRFAHALVDAGVHVVHGHSSHHVKGIEVWNGQPILYGCGDLLTDYEGIHGHEEFHGGLGLLYFVTLDGDHRLARLDMDPVTMRRLQVRRATPPQADWLATTLTRYGRPLGTAAAIADRRLRLVWPGP